MLRNVAMVAEFLDLHTVVLQIWHSGTKLSPVLSKKVVEIQRKLVTDVTLRLFISVKIQCSIDQSIQIGICQWLPSR